MALIAFGLILIGIICWAVIKTFASDVITMADLALHNNPGPLDPKAARDLRIAENEAIKMEEWRRAQRKRRRR